MMSFSDWGEQVTVESPLLANREKPFDAEASFAFRPNDIVSTSTPQAEEKKDLPKINMNLESLFDATMSSDFSSELGALTMGDVDSPSVRTRELPSQKPKCVCKIGIDEGFNMLKKNVENTRYKQHSQTSILGTWRLVIVTLVIQRS